MMNDPDGVVTYELGFVLEPAELPDFMILLVEREGYQIDGQGGIEPTGACHYASKLWSGVSFNELRAQIERELNREMQAQSGWELISMGAVSAPAFERALRRRLAEQ